MDIKKIGLNIKEQRKTKGLTQKDLAQRINRTESSIRKYEKGLVDIPNKVINEIALALDVPISDLIDTQTEKDMMMKEVNDIEDHMKKTEKISDALFLEIKKRYDLLNSNGKLESLKRIEDLRFNKIYRSDNGFATGLPEGDSFDKHLIGTEEIEDELKNNLF